MVKRIRSAKLNDQQVARRLTSDTFVNFAANVGIGTDNISSGNTYGFNPISRVRTLLEWMYRGSWLCGVGVDCVADDMTREWIEIKSGATPDGVERIYGMMRKMQIPQSFNGVAKWARLYGGALGVIMIDGQRLDTPLRLDTIKQGQFQGIVTLDRWMVTPHLMTAVMQPGPDFGNPEFYDITTQTPNLPIPRQRLHYSRCIRMEGVELPFWQKQAENMWGISVLERLYDRLTAFDSTTQGAAQMAFRAYLRTLSVDGLRDIIASGGAAYQALVQNVQLIRQYQSNEGITLIDAKDTFEGHQNTFTGLSDLMNAMGEQIAGALQVPLTRLFGQTPSGLNSDGDAGMRTYEDNIKRQQERWFRRPLDVVIPLCALNAGIELEAGWEYDFVSLRQMTEEQQAEINTADVNAVVNADATGKLPGAVFLKELRQSGRKTGRWTNITDQDIKDAEVADLVPSPSELGLMPGLPGEGNEEEPGNPDPVTGNGKNIGQDPIGQTDKAVLVDVQGLPIFIENHMGTVRTGGRGRGAWQTVMPADYGFIEGVGSAEGAFEQLDCFIGPELDAPDVYIVDQVDWRTGGFDEHKCMIGFKDAAQAMDCYKRAFSDGKGADRLGAITAVPMERFKLWLKTGNHTLPAKGQL